MKSEKSEKPDPILVIDVGNTSTSLGIYQGGVITATKLIPSPAITKSDHMIIDLPPARTIRAAVICSVVPMITQHWVDAVANAHPDIDILLVDYHLNIGIPIAYPEPDTIGADRLANACAASELFGTPVIVADFGTAVTFDVISKKRGYIGGVIAPGLKLMFSYLAEKTAMLPVVDPGPTQHKVGRSTEEAMRLGARWGYRGLVREIFKELKSGLGERGVHFCATGGYAPWVLRNSGIKIPIKPDLTLYGLGRIYELNQ